MTIRNRTIFEALSSFVNTGVDTLEVGMGACNKGFKSVDNVMDTTENVTGRHNRITKMKSKLLEMRQEKEIKDEFPEFAIDS